MLVPSDVTNGAVLSTVMLANVGTVRLKLPMLRFNGGDAEHLGVMIERLLVDTELRDRLVAEASEHVLRFDWDDIAKRTRGLYDGIARPAAAERSTGTNDTERV